MTQRRSPLPLGRILNDRSAAVERLFRTVEFLQSINRLIATSVSSKLAPHCAAAGIRDRQLVVFVDSPAWATRLHFEQNQLLQHLRQQPELNLLTGLQIKVRPKEPMPAKPIRRAQSLSQESTADIKACADSIGDPALSRALRRLAEHGSKRR